MEYTEAKDVEIRIEYTLGKEGETVPVITGSCNNSVLDYEKHSIDSKSRFGLNESIMFPSRRTQIISKLNDLQNVYLDLGYSDPNVLKSAFNLIQAFVLSNKYDFKISKTGHNELLFYREHSGEFSNVIIDEDGDISYIYIAKKLGQEKSDFFPKSKGIDYSKIANLI